MDSLEERIAATERRLYAWCREREVTITGDGAISEPDTAALLGLKSTDTLRKAAAEGMDKLPYRKSGNRRWYRLHDIARDMEESYVQP
ncbi:DNA-binding protein [Cupriavidus taiwanensis]|uniref:Uncharacterized protein n=1 Tax=Cupriavidus taiwanensis TaxID=164546 RepID=A0A375J2G8_9BURK|nr:DNA-binding protein [Cupriavidus taiwanensis]SPR99307.1 conserved hypothetical protein [Cupriavidus taiwanensis]